MKNKKEKAKQNYEHPIIKSIRFKIGDVLATSGNFNVVPEEPGIDLPIDPFEP